MWVLGLFCASSSGLGASPWGGGRVWDTALLSPGHVSPPCQVRHSNTFTGDLLCIIWVLGWSFSLYIPCSPPSRCSGISFSGKGAPRPHCEFQRTSLPPPSITPPPPPHTHWILSLLLIACHNSIRLSFPVSISCTSRWMANIYSSICIFNS